MGHVVRHHCDASCPEHRYTDQLPGNAPTRQHVMHKLTLLLSGSVLVR